MRRSLLLPLVLVAAACARTAGADPLAHEAPWSTASTGTTSASTSASTSAPSASTDPASSSAAPDSPASTSVAAAPSTSSPTRWTGTPEPFLAGIGRPVGLAVAPDGSIVVGDWETGTIYRVSAG